MQIRERGQKTVCIKTKYDTIAKRTFGFTAFSQPIHLDKPANEAKKVLTVDEIKELAEWLLKRQKDNSVIDAARSVRNAKTWINNATEALREYDEAKTELTEKQADELFESISELRKELKKAGYRSPRQKEVQKPSQEPSSGRKTV
jgi:capsule polysaccharide export protein KpsE/RkpR